MSRDWSISDQSVSLCAELSAHVVYYTRSSSGRNHWKEGGLVMGGRREGNDGRLKTRTLSISEWCFTFLEYWRFHIRSDRDWNQHLTPYHRTVKQTNGTDTDTDQWILVFTQTSIFTHISLHGPMLILHVPFNFYSYLIPGQSLFFFYWSYFLFLCLIEKEHN